MRCATGNDIDFSKQFFFLSFLCNGSRHLHVAHIDQLLSLIWLFYESSWIKLCSNYISNLIIIWKWCCWWNLSWSAKILQLKYNNVIKKQQFKDVATFRVKYTPIHMSNWSFLIISWLRNSGFWPSVVNDFSWILSFCLQK